MKPNSGSFKKGQGKGVKKLKNILKKFGQKKGEKNIGKSSCR